MELLLISFLLLLSSIVTILYLKMKQELQFYRLQEKDLDEYTSEVETIYRQIRGLRHDYRNHLQNLLVFTTEQKYDELQQYLQELIHEQNKVDTIIKTGNILIDAIVNTKLTKAREQGIKIDAQAIAPATLVIQNVDLAIILGNLLTNALEATSKNFSSSMTSPFIRLYIAPMNGNLYINVTNSMIQAPQKHFLSLKQNNRHGYGLQRIDTTVDKYNGIVNRQWEDGVFATEITLPLQ